MLTKTMPFLALALGACATTHSVPPTPAKIYCLTPAQYKKLVDAEPAKIGNQISSDPRIADQQKTRQNVLVRQYADGLLAVLGNCVG